MGSYDNLKQQMRLVKKKLTANFYDLMSVKQDCGKKLSECNLKESDKQRPSGCLAESAIVVSADSKRNLMLKTVLYDTYSKLYEVTNANVLIGLLTKIKDMQVSIFVDIDEFSKEDFEMIKTESFIFRKIGKKISLFILSCNSMEKLQHTDDLKLVKGWIRKTQNDEMVVDCNNIVISNPSSLLSYIQNLNN